MSRDDVYLLDMLESARLALRYVEGKTEEEFLKDLQLQDSVIRRLVVIGEAARRLSAATRESQPHSPWQTMIDMRNFVVHEYDDVDARIVWETVQENLPSLIRRLTDIVLPQG